MRDQNAICAVGSGELSCYSRRVSYSVRDSMEGVLVWRYAGLPRPQGGCDARVDSQELRCPRRD